MEHWYNDTDREDLNTGRGTCRSVSLSAIFPMTEPEHARWEAGN